MRISDWSSDVCSSDLLEHGKVDDPQGLPAGFEQTVILAEFAVADLYAQSTDRVINHLDTVGAEKDQVAALSDGTLYNGGQGIRVYVLDDRRLQAIRNRRGIEARKSTRLNYSNQC